MKKKVIIISALSVVMVLVVLAIIHFLGSNNNKKSDVFEAIPKDASMIISINDVENFLNIISFENVLTVEFLKIINLDCQNSTLHYCDSLSVFEILNPDKLETKTLLSFHPEGVNPFTQLLVYSLPEKVKQKKHKSNFNDVVSKLGKITERDYKEITVFELNFNGELPNIHYSFTNGLFLLSFSPMVIEKSIDQLLDEKTILDAFPGLSNIHQTAGQKEIANFYINMASFPNALSVNASQSYIGFFENLKSTSGWTELDMSVAIDKLSFNGFSAKSDSVANYHSVLNSQEPTELRAIEVLPDNTSMHYSISINNSEAFESQMTEYCKLIGTETQRSQELEKIKSETGIDLKYSFYPMIESEVTFAITKPGTTNLYGNSFLIFSLNSQSSSVLELMNILGQASTKLNRPIEDFQDKMKIDERTSIDVYILPFEGLPGLLFGENFDHCTGKYVCFINNFMVFANTKDALFKFAYDALLNKTLKTSIEYNLFVENFSHQSNMFFYFSMFNGFEIFKDIFNDSTKNVIDLNHDQICSMGLIGYQINKSNDLLYNNFVVKHTDHVEEKPQTIWESRLDTTISTKPALVINHNNNSKEIVIQDKKNILYLLSNSGREVWRLKLDEKITSPVYQIDLYKNGKLQYLFSSKNKLHVIDRLGNYVEKYPVELRSAATAPLSLFDYDGNRNYRIIIPCEDNKVYLYDGLGSIVNGWEFEGAENKVNSEISHYRAGSEDYIVFNDEYKAYFVNRTGESKIDFLTKFKFSTRNKIWFDGSSSKPRFVATDEKGTIHYFFTDGTQDSIKIEEFSTEHFFALEDLDRDGNKDFVFVDKNRMEVYNKSEELIMSYDFETNVDFPPVFYSFPRNQTKIGIVCSTGSQIFLINHDGSLFNGFPLFGLTPFSIGYLSSEANKFNLIVGGQDNLLYNYEVNEN